MKLMKTYIVLPTFQFSLHSLSIVSCRKTEEKKAYQPNKVHCLLVTKANVSCVNSKCLNLLTYICLFIFSTLFWQLFHKLTLFPDASEWMHFCVSYYTPAAIWTYTFTRDGGHFPLKFKIHFKPLGQVSETSSVLLLSMIWMSLRSTRSFLIWLDLIWQSLMDPCRCFHSHFFPLFLAV